MTSRLSRILVVVLLLSALLAPQAGATAADEADFVAGVNQTRANVGLPPLQLDAQLVSLARGWANQMRDGVCGSGNYICHASPISAGVTHNWAKLGENVGTGGDVASVMQAFIDSPGHYANIVDPEFTHVGVAVVWEGGRLYTTHRFMKLQNAAPTTTAPPATAAPTTTAGPTSTAAPTTAAPTTTTSTSDRAPVESGPPENPFSIGVDTDAATPPVELDRATVVLDAFRQIS